MLIFLKKVLWEVLMRHTKSNINHIAGNCIVRNCGVEGGSKCFDGFRQRVLYYGPGKN